MSVGSRPRASSAPANGPPLMAHAPTAMTMLRGRRGRRRSSRNASFHVRRHRPGDHKPVGVARRGDELDPEAAQVEHDVAQCAEFRLAPAASTGRYLSQCERSAEEPAHLRVERLDFVPPHDPTRSARCGYAPPAGDRACTRSHLPDTPPGTRAEQARAQIDTKRPRLRSRRVGHASTHARHPSRHTRLIDDGAPTEARRELGARRAGNRRPMIHDAGGPSEDRASILLTGRVQRRTD